jgi:Tfp pilus assembly protein PilO
MMYRRQKQQYIFAGLLGVIALINVLFFFILHRPVRAEYSQLQNSIATLRAEGALRQQGIDRLERTSMQLERFEQDRLELFTNHFVPRDAGFAEILPQLDAMAERAGVRKSRVDYAPEPIPNYALESVTITLPVQGAYDEVVAFIMELETSDILYLINFIDVRSVQGSGPSVGTGTIELALTLETFFYR